MSAIIIILPQPLPAIDTSPSECDPCAPVDLTRALCGGRPPRGRPCLVYDRARIVTDDDFFAEEP